jgi:hypothetical protein
MHLSRGMHIDSLLMNTVGKIAQTRFQRTMHKLKNERKILVFFLIHFVFTMVSASC